jgi:hypothetical protein
MSYFDRLAGRALGVRSPFAAMPRTHSWFDDGGVVTEEVETPAAQTSRSQSASAATSAAARRSDRSTEPVTGWSRPVSVRAQVTGAVARVSPSGDRSAPEPVPVPASATDAGDEEAPAPASDELERELERPSPSDAPDVPAATELIAVENRTSVLPRGEPRRSLQRDEATLPPVAAAPDVIRVHIGRVEVRAIFPAPAPAPRPVARSAPAVSLDQFLSRGRGGR